MSTSAAPERTRETVYTCYVVGPRRRLLGVVTVRSLLLARDEPARQRCDGGPASSPSRPPGRTRRRPCGCCSGTASCRCPWWTRKDRLVGIVTVDDVMDVMEEEATEDFEKMAAMAPIGEAVSQNRRVFPGQGTASFGCWC